MSINSDLTGLMVPGNKRQMQTSLYLAVRDVKNGELVFRQELKKGTEVLLQLPRVQKYYHYHIMRSCVNRR